MCLAEPWESEVIQESLKEKLSLVLVTLNTLYLDLCTNGEKQGL